MDSYVSWLEAEWVHLPPLTLDAHGQPDYGALLRYVRKQIKGWSADYLAEQYSTALWLLFGSKDAVITARWIQKMEHDNALPQDPVRRATLAAILGIPPAALGLRDVFKQNLRAVMIPRKQRIDPEEYRAALDAYWRAYYTGTVLLCAEQIMERLYDLHNSVLYVKEPNVFMDLLCRYQILIALIACDQQDSETTLEYLRDALILAKRLKNEELRAFVLYYRAGVYFDQGHITKAIANSEAARAIEGEINLNLRAAISLSGGFHVASNAQSKEEVSAAINQIDRGEYLLEHSTSEPDEYFVKPSPERIHLNRALAYLGSPLRVLRSPERALIEIDYTKNLIDSTSRRRLMYTNFLEAKAYVDRGQPEQALKLAEAMLETVEEMKSVINLDRLGQVYKLLREYPKYGRQAEVVQLGLRLKVARIKLQMLH
ncbi:MAG: hypothetical protein JO202_13915 [Ktedonobacteraceae bacterium]|nr:hypothetical protein [Ktedonobacteraceae bacterium]